MKAPVYNYRYTAIFIVMLLLSLIVHIGGSIELALMSYKAVIKALQQLTSPEANFDDELAKKDAEEKKEKLTDKWIVSERKYGSESGFIWIEDDSIALPSKIPDKPIPPAPTPTASEQKALPLSPQEASKMLQEQTEQPPSGQETVAEKSINPTQIINSDIKPTSYEKLLPNLLKTRNSASLPQKPAPEKPSITLQALHQEFTNFAQQRQKQQNHMLIPKGNDRFTSKSMYVEELPPEQQIRMDSYMRRMVWTMDNIGKSLPLLRMPEDAGVHKLSAYICIQLDRKGNIIKLELEKSCGYKEFDERALFIFKEAKNFGDLPSFYTPSTCTQHWTFSFIPQAVSGY